MRTICLLLVLCLLPAGSATHETGSQQALNPDALVIARLELHQTAARPPADLEGVLILTSGSQRITINGSIQLGGPIELAPSPEEQPPPQNGIRTTLAGFGQGEILAHLNLSLDPFTKMHIPFQVPIRDIGYGTLSFEAELEEGRRVRADQVAVYGLAPIDVVLESPAPGAQLVSIPERPAQMTLNLTARPGSNLTNLTLSLERMIGVVDPVEVGDLPAGTSVTVTLELPADADGPLRSRSVHRLPFIPYVNGYSDGHNFGHPLYTNHEDRLEPIHFSVYGAPESTLFLIPPVDARLGESTSFDVMVLNAGTKAIRAKGHVDASLPGMPHLDRRFFVDTRVESGTVETVGIDWTPVAAGPWRLSVSHNLDQREQQVEHVHVRGPLSEIDFQVPSLERGKLATAFVALTAPQDTHLHTLGLTMPQAPQQATITIDDIFAVQPVQAGPLPSGSPTTFAMELRPEATGQYELYLVAQTPEGPSVYGVGAVTVTGSTGGWPLAWSPTIAVGLLVGLHVAWRRRWVE